MGNETVIHLGEIAVNLAGIAAELKEANRIKQLELGALLDAQHANAYPPSETPGPAPETVDGLLAAIIAEGHAPDVGLHPNGHWYSSSHLAGMDANAPGSEFSFGRSHPSAVGTLQALLAEIRKLHIKEDEA